MRFVNGTQWFIQVGCSELICIVLSLKLLEGRTLAEVVEEFPSFILLLWLVNAD